MSRRKLRVRVDKIPWRVTKAQLVLDDNFQHGANKPMIFIDVVRDDDSDSWAYEREFTIYIQGQRSLVGDRDGFVRKPAEGIMDTRKRWGTTFAVHMELGYDSQSIKIEAEPFRLRLQDRVKIEVAKALAAEIKAGNLDRVHPDEEMLQIMEAFERLGVYTLHQYRTSKQDAQWNWILESITHAVPFLERANAAWAAEQELLRQDQGLNDSDVQQAWAPEAREA